MFELSEISVSYKPSFKVSERPRITGSKDAEKIFRSAWSDKLSYCEEFVIMLLNRANAVLGVCKISSGGVSGTIADPKLIFQPALLGNASGIILAHNHHSGNLKPSQADINLTRKIKEGATLLDMEVLDHIILTEESFYSFADEGMMYS